MSRRVTQSDASVIIIGDSNDSLTQSIHKHLRRSQTTENITTCATIAEALTEMPAVARRASLIVVVQTWPGQYSSKIVNELIGATLHTRLVCILGPWCESEGRSHDVWPDAFRCPSWMAESRLDDLLSAIRDGSPLLPATASRSEVFADQMTVTSEPPNGRDLFSEYAIVVTPDRVLGRTVCDLLKSRHVRSSLYGLTDVSAEKTSWPDSDRVTLVFVDLDPGSEFVCQQVSELVQRFPTARHVGITSVVDGKLETASEFEERIEVIPKLNLDRAIQEIISNSPASPRT